ncbi:hypothetical protein F4809DRAFT_413781 [Biscogniauxia mediterranea]|nr:hypothetical protein F4809DRAFT_413781 [Biscogniauxia mediterranea]
MPSRACCSDANARFAWPLTMGDDGTRKKRILMTKKPKPLVVLFGVTFISPYCIKIKIKSSSMAQTIYYTLGIFNSWLGRGGEGKGKGKMAERKALQAHYERRTLVVAYLFLRLYDTTCIRWTLASLHNGMMIHRIDCTSKLPFLPAYPEAVDTTELVEKCTGYPKPGI